MQRLLFILLATVIGMVFSACGTPPRQPPPDYEKVHQNHQEAQEDLRDEEDKQDEE